MTNFNTYDLVFKNHFLHDEQLVSLYHPSKNFSSDDVWQKMDATINDAEQISTIFCEKSMHPVFRVSFKEEKQTLFLNELDNEYDSLYYIEEEDGIEEEDYPEWEYEVLNPIPTKERITMVYSKNEVNSKNGVNSMITWNRNYKPHKNVKFYARCKRHANPTYVEIDWINHKFVLYVAEFKNSRKNRGGIFKPCKYGFYVSFLKEGQRITSDDFWVKRIPADSIDTHEKSREYHFSSDIDGLEVSRMVLIEFRPR